MCLPLCTLCINCAIHHIPYCLSAVVGSRNGGTLAFAGLLGSALFMLTINAGVLAIYFKPVIERVQILRDGVYLVASLLWLGLSLLNSEWSIWNAVVMFLLYFIYVAIVWATERRRLGKYNLMVEDPLPLPDEQPLSDEEAQKLLGDLGSTETFLRSQVRYGLQKYPPPFFLSIYLSISLSLSRFLLRPCT